MATETTTERSTIARPATRRAFAVIRQSRSNDGMSPDHQRERIDRFAEHDGYAVTEYAVELDVSAGLPLKKRPGLLAAVEAVERGDADVVIVAYFDRLVRSLKTQAEVVERVEAAGGRIWAVDVGEVSSATAGMWLSSTMLGMVAEYHRRSTAERTADAKRDAVARGVAPFSRIPPGIRRRDPDRVLEPDPLVAPLVVEAFERRAAGQTIAAIRAWLCEQGISVTEKGVRYMLASRMYLGELRFGQHFNASVFPPIVDPALWQRVQALVVPKGRQAKSDHLLARLGVLRCASCGGPMTVMSRRWPSYRCPAERDCPDHPTISAAVAEQVVTEATKIIHRARRGEASIVDQRADAAQALSDAVEARDAAVEAFDGIGGETVKSKLQALQTAVDAAEARYQELAAISASDLSLVVDDWELLTLDEQRRLIRLAVEHAAVQPARPGLASADRILIQPRRQ